MLWPMKLPSETYNERVEAGLLTADSAQLGILSHLDAFVTNLTAPHTDKNFLQRLFGARRPAKGLYLYGPVGRGKSFLMDMVYDCVPVTLKRRRQHFHQFMRDVHQRLDGLRKTNQADPLGAVINQLSSEVDVLAFDEMFVKDVADAMILGRLFTGLFAKGMIVLMTTNIAPDDLYKDGLQRVRFVPFIDLIKHKLDVINVAGDTDHRRMRLLGTAAYYTPLGNYATGMLQSVFDRLTAGVAASPQTLFVDGRELRLNMAARGVLMTSFAEICEANLGPSDMLEIAACFTCVILDGVPVLTADKRNETMRFITLVDALYDARRQLFMAADAPLNNLIGPGNMLAFDFVRTASRIDEMQAADYQDEVVGEYL